MKRFLISVYTKFSSYSLLIFITVASMLDNIKLDIMTMAMTLFLNYCYDKIKNEKYKKIILVVYAIFSVSFFLGMAYFTSHYPEYFEWLK